MNRRQEQFLRWLALALCFALCAWAVSAIRPRVAHAANGETPTPQQNTVDTYRIDRQTTAYRTALGSADSTTVNAAFAAAVPAFVCGNASSSGARVNLGLQARFSAAGTTCKVRVVYYYKDAAGTLTNFRAGDEITLAQTGTATLDGAGLRFGDSIDFDSKGATDVRVMLTTAPSSGTVDFWLGSY